MSLVSVIRKACSPVIPRYSHKLLLWSALSLVVIYSLLTNIHYPPSGWSRLPIHPPELTPSQVQALNSMIGAGNLTGSRTNLRSPALNDTMVLNLVSSILQQQLNSLQEPENCSGMVTIECGHTDGLCGLGCQVHCRLACLMISYMFNVPWIHNEKEGWTYTQIWSEMYEPLGSKSCQPGPNTYKIEWISTSELPKIYRKYCDTCNADDTLQLPQLRDGILVPASLASVVNRIHPNPTLWWHSQFINYGLKLNSATKAKIYRDKSRIGFTDIIAQGTPIVGIHVRRTDKLKEDRNSVHGVDEYFAAANQFLKSSEIHTQSATKFVFIASDNHEVLLNASKSYRLPEWNVMSFPSNRTLEGPIDRSPSLYEIVRDVSILAECDYILCGYSSNICRLLLELLTIRFSAEDARLRVHSLDGEYSYVYSSP